MLALLAAVLLAGCVVGPDHKSPAIDDELTWIDTSVDAGEPPARWWRRFGDPTLDELIEETLRDNLDLAAAAERIIQARTAVVAAGASARPAANADASAARQRQSETGPLPAGRIPGIPTYQTVYDIGIDARWELDLFGRTRRAVEAADARVAQSEAQRHALQVSLVAEVARRYFDLRGTQSELAAALAGVAAAERTVELVRRQFDAGSIPREAVLRAEADLAITRTRTSPLRSRRDASALALGFLTGRGPAAHVALRDTAGALPALDPVPAGTPADVLRRRPDVRIAERSLAAATASVGVAQGALYPRLVLGAAAGFTTLESGELLDPASRSWSLAPILAWRLLDDGRIRAEISAAESRQREAAIGYERAVLAALTEAEQALHAYRHARDQVAVQEAAAAAVVASRDLVETRYRAGALSLLTLLDAERRVAEAQTGTARAHTEAARALVAVYKTLGGGWSS